VSLFFLRLHSRQITLLFLLLVSSGKLYADHLQVLVENGLKRRDAQYLKQIFKSHAENGLLSKGNLSIALSDLKIFINESVLDEMFEMHDLDKNNGLDEEEFGKLVKNSVLVSQWVKDMPLHELLADCLLLWDGGRNGNSFEQLSKLTAEEINAISAAYQKGFVQILEKAVSDLSHVHNSALRKHSTSSAVGAKFQVYQYNCGNVSDFHMGLGNRLGRS
jgi:Ca2+-binding EF-hand superfamily protein